MFEKSQEKFDSLSKEQQDAFRKSMAELSEGFREDAKKWQELLEYMQEIERKELEKNARQGF